GVDDSPPAESGLRAQHEVVAASRQDRLGEAKLSVTRSGARDPGEGRCRPVMDVDARPVLDRRELFESDVEPVADRERSGLDERVVSAKLVAREAREAVGDSLR